jgi:hypothetical protein
MDEPRYAIYFVPPARSDLYRFGARFLGYDCYSGDDLGHPPDIGLAATAWEELTREPRRYGFHATLKAPFRLLPPFTEANLVAELDRFIALPRASVSVEPTIRAIERFIAIVPRGTSAAVDQLAADCETVFDRFRRPPTPQERDRRVAAGACARPVMMAFVAGTEPKVTCGPAKHTPALDSDASCSPAKFPTQRRALAPDESSRAQRDAPTREFAP